MCADVCIQFFDLFWLGIHQASEDGALRGIKAAYNAFDRYKETKIRIEINENNYKRMYIYMYIYG